jgi:hypothetical protein
MDAGWNVLVNFPDGTREIALVTDGPVVGSEIVSADRKLWTVTKSSIREGEVEGRQIHFEVSVEPQETSEEPVIELR